jgi:antitoxin component YwqK of YwqJK toxin-antitoxin module
MKNIALKRAVGNTPLEPHEIKITYYPDIKTIEENIIYKNGKRDGLCESWYGNGQLFNKCNYKKGKKNGLYEKYYKNGKLDKNCSFKNRNRDGLYEEWYSDGRLYI